MPTPKPEVSYPEKSRDLEFARESLREELEAINFYQARIDTTADESLKTVLAHNRDEEKEHVAELLEWIHQNDSKQEEMFNHHD